MSRKKNGGSTKNHGTVEKKANTVASSETAHIAVHWRVHLTRALVLNAILT